MSLFLVGISRQKSEEKTNKTKIAKQRIESCRSVSLSLYISYLSLFTHLSLCLQVTPKTGFSSLMYYSTFPLVTCLVWKSACVCLFFFLFLSFFFYFDYLLLIDMCFLIGKERLQNQPIEELNLPLVCVLSVLVTSLCCWMF